MTGSIGDTPETAGIRLLEEHGLAAYRTVILDCDGVVLDSNGVKTEAFRQALAGHPADQVAALIDYHKTHGGVSRYRKFEYFFAEIAKTDDDESRKRALDAFAQAVQSALRRAELTSGARRFFSRVTETASLYIVSGGVEKEIRQVLADKDCEKYFAEILGNPTTKEDHFKYLLEAVGIRHPVLFVGDSAEDYKVARRHEVDFLFMTDYTEEPAWEAFCADEKIKTIPNFAALLE